MLRPSIFGESLFDDWMDDFPFGKEFEKEMFPEKSPLYGKHHRHPDPGSGRGQSGTDPGGGPGGP